MFNNKSILITGGTGSFGRQYVKTILANYKPKRLVVFSRDELKQFEMKQEFNQDCMRYFLGDVRDYERILEATKGIDYIIHAAAIKQVPASEYNPGECVKTNIYGAQNVIRAAINNNVKKTIALSTDKAANPINLYGATKLASDKLFIAANNTVGDAITMFSVVRYGNVIGSRGSVVPYFTKLLKEGAQSLPITHKDMTRFTITLQQGVDFVLKNFARMQGGEIFVPKIPSIKIVDMAKAMAKDIQLEYIGIRPGEKIHETMCPEEYSHLTLEFDDHFVIKPSITFNRKICYEKNPLGEVGKPVDLNFSYNSKNNPHWLTRDEFMALVKQSNIEVK